MSIYLVIWAQVWIVVAKLAKDDTLNLKASLKKVGKTSSINAIAPCAPPQVGAYEDKVVTANVQSRDIEAGRRSSMALMVPSKAVQSSNRDRIDSSTTTRESSARMSIGGRSYGSSSPFTSVASPPSPFEQAEYSIESPEIKRIVAMTIPFNELQQVHEVSEQDSPGLKTFDVIKIMLTCQQPKPSLKYII